MPQVRTPFISQLYVMKLSQLYNNTTTTCRGGVGVGVVAVVFEGRFLEIECYSAAHFERRISIVLVFFLIVTLKCPKYQSA